MTSNNTFLRQITRGKAHIIMQASPHKFTQLHFREKSPKLESAYRRKLREEQEKSTSGKRDSSVDSNKKKGRVSELKGVFQKFYTVLFI